MPSAQFQKLISDPVYKKLLTEGIKSQEDIQRALELLSALEPDDGAILAQKARELNIEFRFLSAKEFPIAGSQAVTSTSIDRAANRSLNEVGTPIMFNVDHRGPFSEYGASLLVLKHELVHAIPFDQLPQCYREPFTAEPISDPHNVNSIYRSVLSSLWADEAMATMSGVHLKANLSRAIDISSYPVLESDLKAISKFEVGSSTGVPTFAELAEQLKNHGYYGCEYRCVALQIAITKRFGGHVDNISVNDILNQLTEPAVVDGAPCRAVNPQKVREMFMNHIMPTLQTKAPDLLLGLMGMGPAVLESITKLMSGDVDAQRAFFTKDMDKLIQQIARVIGDEVVELTEQLSSPLEALKIPSRPRRVREARPPLEDIDRRETTADKVEILGKYVELLYKLCGTTSDEIRNHVNDYLNFAEHCDSESAARVYSILLTTLADNGSFAGHGARSLGFSLLRSGYTDKGKEILKDVINHLGLGYGELVRLHSSQIQELIRGNHQDLLSAYLTKIFELSEPELLSFDEWITSTSTDFPEHDNGHEVVRATIFAVTEALKDPELASKIDPQIKQEILAKTDLLWGQLQTWMEKKIERYMKDVAGCGEYRSIDEMTARNPQGGGNDRFDDGSILVGFWDRSSQNLNHWDFIACCLESPLLFEKGCQFLERYPLSQQKLRLFIEAAKHIPEDAPDSVRTNVVQQMNQALHDL